MNTIYKSNIDSYLETIISSIEEPKKNIHTTNINISKNVWILAEQRNGTIHKVINELLYQGNYLAAKLKIKLAAILLGENIKTLATELFTLGADQVYLADDPRLAKFNDDIYCEVIANLIKKYKPEIFLAGATAIGRSLMPRIATAVNTGLTSDCIALTINKKNKLLLQIKPSFSGNQIAIIICPKTKPQMATIRPKITKKYKFSQKYQYKSKILIKILINPNLKSSTEVIEEILYSPQKTNLPEANIVIVGGRGLGNPKGFTLANDLAKELNGIVGATRGAVELGWIDYNYQIGQSGHTISPNLYIGLGVSGAIQHLVGMQSSKIIVAINSDFKAPIFSVSTYGIIGNIYEIVPAMLQYIQKLKIKNKKI